MDQPSSPAIAMLLGQLDYTRARLMGSLEPVFAIGREALAYRPGPGRAHLAWQAMHCAATHDRYLNLRLLGKPTESDPQLCANFGGGSTPSDDLVPDADTIRATLAKHFEPLRQYVIGLDESKLGVQLPLPNGKTRSVLESLQLLAWHEAHHEGQIHLTRNFWKARTV